MNYELSSDDMVNVIRRYKPSFPHQDIIEYPDLANMNLDILLPNENVFKVIFFITSQSAFSKSGHWVCIARKKHKIVWFDSYGLKPDHEEKWLSKRERRQFGENKPIMHEIVPANELTYNPFDFQSKKNNVSTCGRWTAFFCIYCCIQGHTIIEMHSYIERRRCLTKQSYDKIITDLIQI